MPFTDWQFWVVTLAATVAMAVVVRTVLPKKKRKKTRTTLTVSAKKSCH